MLNQDDITPGLPAGEEAIEAADVWMPVEDQQDFVGGMRLDAADAMTERLEGTRVNELTVDEISEDSDHDTHGGRGRCRPALHATFVTLRFSGERGGGVRSMMMPPSICRKPTCRTS